MATTMIEIPLTLAREVVRLMESGLDNAKAIRAIHVANLDTKDGRILANAYTKEVSDIEVLLDSLLKCV